jgi:hypothetical protein
MRVAMIGLVASCAFHANQALPGDGGDLGGSDASMGSGSGSGSGSGTGSGSGSGMGSGSGSGMGSGHGSGSGGLLPCPTASWFQAEQDCEDDAISNITGPTHLIVLDDQNEAVYAWSVNNSNQWLGHTDIETEGTFLPVTDQTGTYSGGASGNNGSKNCLMTKDSSGATSADTCTTGHPYICECDGYAPDPNNYQ